MSFFSWMKPFSNSAPLNLWSAHAPPSASLFPRYGHTLSTTAAINDQFFLFGGKFADRSLSNDLYVISTHDFSTTLLKTSGETPPPRQYHSATLTSTLFLVWGGSAVREEDDSLYVLNLGMSDLLMSRPAPADQSLLTFQRRKSGPAS